ncbi:MAG TPA: hypothetical protein VJT80_08105 [Steroidobacteraceae bacterium]|jgi:hypothetical protein|nr:hypothetical protein [Steroidobacteraceae bacterium]
MKTVIGIVASLLVNAAVIGGLAWSAYQQQLPPLGEVLVVQLPDDSSLPAIAEVRSVGPSAARAL